MKPDYMGYICDVPGRALRAWLTLCRLCNAITDQL